MWTVLGGSAIPLWATWPALSLHTHEIPPLECLSMVFLAAWLVVALVEQSLVQKNLPSPVSRPGTWQGWCVAAAFGGAEVGSTEFFLLATHRIAAAEANLIVFLWPGMVVLLCAALGTFRLRSRHLAGLALGFLGVVILIGIDHVSVSVMGIGLALLAGLSWALYCVLRLTWSAFTGPVLARGLALAAGLCTALHFLFEPTVWPSVPGAAAAMAAGIVPTGIANVAWDEGFRRGDSQLLTVMAYATPLCSALILALLGVEPLTGRILMGAIAIVAAGIMSRSDTLSLRQ